MNWGPGPQGGFYNALAMGQQAGNNFMQAFQQGRQMKEEREYKNALAQFDPSKPETLKPIMAARPEVGLQLQAQVQRQQAAAQASGVEGLDKLRPLLVKAAQSPEGWQQAMGAAQSMGLDLSRVPQQYDPQWAQQQIFIADAMKDPAQVDQLDRDLQRLGFQPGQPGYEEAARELILFGRGKPVTSADGRAALELPTITLPGQTGGQQQPTIQNTPAPALGPNGMPTVLTREQYQAIEAEQGVADTADWAMRNGVKVVARTGTDASGRRVIQYNDGTIDYAGN